MHIEPLGDQALLARLASEAEAIAFTTAVRTAGLSWVQDVVPAYSTVGVFFDAEQVNSANASEVLRTLPLSDTAESVGKHLRIPVCYEFPLDLPRVAEQTKLPADEIIRLHTSQPFTIYAIGFVPGFPYMGYLPEKLGGVPRLATPRLRVEPGSVGITGKQTGIYPLPRPGGWNLIGRTPLTLVDVEGEYFPLRVGDRVQFERIDEAEFSRLQGERL
jgi:inhibitor of KinA